jgi:uncharacterized protein (DUF58 family)
MIRALQDSFTKATGKWLFQLRDAEPGEAFLNQRRVFILPTGPGLGLGALLFILFIGSINYNLSLGFALTFLIAGCAVIDMHLTFRNLAHLHLLAGRVQPVYAGEEAQFELNLINRRKHDRYAIWLGFIGAGLPDLAQAADVPAHGSCRVMLSAPARQRGWLQAPRVRLQTRFPLGLLRAWSYWQPDAKALVYPRPEQNAPPLPMRSEGEPDGQGNAGQDDFAGIRAYQVGDSMKRLAWRHIARLGNESNSALVSKHFEGGAASELQLDFATLPQGMDLESKLSRMTGWVIEAEARGAPYSFRLGGIAFPAALGPAHQEACLRALALYEAA